MHTPTILPVQYTNDESRVKALASIAAPLVSFENPVVEETSSLHTIENFYTQYDWYNDFNPDTVPGLVKLVHISSH